jgi:hypothetical protein
VSYGIGRYQAIRSGSTKGCHKTKHEAKGQKPVTVPIPKRVKYIAHQVTEINATQRQRQKSVILIHTARGQGPQLSQGSCNVACETHCSKYRCASMLGWVLHDMSFCRTQIDRLRDVGPSIPTDEMNVKS